MQDLYARLTRGFISSNIYIYIKCNVCKASMLD